MIPINQKLQPKLRFPEFKGDWKYDQIENYIDFFSGIALKSDDISDDKSGIPILRGINITEGYIRHSKEIDRYFLGSIEKIKKYFVKENDLVLGMDGSKVGKNVSLIKKEDENSILIQRVARIRANDKSNIKYIYQQIFSKKFHDYVDIVNTSSGIPHISAQQIKEFKIGFPALLEQTKIANFLTSVDKKLNLLKEKKEALEEYKKGMMQKIFSQEIRFKNHDRKDLVNWDKKSLNKLVQIYDGTHQTPNYVEQGVQFYSVEHVTANQFSKTKFITQEVFDKENKRVKLEKDDILMTRIGSIGIARLIDWDVTASFYVSLALLKKSTKISNKYLVHFIHSDFFQNELWKRTIHVAFPQKINLGEIGECIVKFPCEKEQIKIANFLSSIDEKIELISTQIEDTQEYKKGLLQQMFI